VSPAADRRLGPAFGRSPVSAGPYLVRQWLSGDRIVLERFDAYRGPRPYYDQLVFRVVPAPDTRLAMVERSEAQIGTSMPPQLVRVAGSNPELRVIRLEGTSLYYFWFNLDRAPLHDVRVRRALNLAVDRSAIIMRLALGAASPARSLMERIVRHSCAVGTLDYAPEVARRLLREARVLGQRLRLLASDGQWPLDRQVAEAVAAYLREIGMDPELRLISDTAAFMEAAARRDAHLGLLTWGGSTGDPDQYLRRQLWGPVAGQLWNLAGYRNPRVDTLIERGGQTFDESERARIYCEAQQLAWNDWPWLVLHRQDGAAVVRADIEGIRVYANSRAHVFTHARPVAR
jgi:peptide/nickel transport system substrate-binding protein